MIGTPLSNIKGIFKSVGKISEVFKEGQKQKKWSAKRSIAGVLVGTVVMDVTEVGINWENTLMAFVAVSPLIASYLFPNIQKESNAKFNKRRTENSSKFRKGIK
jgi:riboflavin transporter FmnP